MGGRRYRRVSAFEGVGGEDAGEAGGGEGEACVGIFLRLSFSSGVEIEL